MALVRKSALSENSSRSSLYGEHEVILCGGAANLMDPGTEPHLGQVGPGFVDQPSKALAL